MSQKKQYTFDDWKRGKVDADFEEGRIPQIISKGLGTLSEKVYREGLIPDKEYRKIEKAQMQAFFIAVEKTVNTLNNLFREKIDYSPNPDKLLDIQIAELKERVEDAPRYRLKDVYSGKWDPSGINSYKYHEIMNAADGQSLIHISNPSGIPDDAGRNRILAFYVKSAVRIFEPFLSEERLQEIPIEAQPLDIGELIFNQIYDLTVVCKFLNDLEQLKKNGVESTNQITSGDKNDYPDPKVIAKEFKKRTKSKDKRYSVEDISFVMRYARDNPDEEYYSELIRNLRKEKKCPDILADKKEDNTNAERRWIKFYDERAQIVRK